MTGVAQMLLRGLLISSLSLLLAEAHTVELNVVVDYLAMRSWKENSGKSTNEELREELDSIFVEVSKLYGSLEYWHLPVKFVIKNLTLDVSVVSSPYGEIGQEGLGQFRKWMYDRKEYEAGDWDIAILLTGLDVVGDTKSLLGFGQIDRVCTDWGVGMLEFRSQDYGDAFVMAHEIGHILGANHDGFQDIPNTFCDPKEGYIMTPNVPIRFANHFKFSYCSYNYFYDSLANGHWDCLKDSDNPHPVTGKRLGLLEGADETCRRTLGEDAFVYRPEYFVYGNRACTSLMCDDGGGSTKRTFSPQGMLCGKNKQCIQGKCVKTKAGIPDVPDECPFGDSPKINYKGYKSCDDLPLDYCGVMKDLCCKRCGGVIGLRDGDKACKEKMNNEDAMLSRGVYNSYGDAVCRTLVCTTGLDKHGKETDKRFTAPNGMACGKGKRCQDEKCVPTDANPPTVLDFCPFGDQAWDWWTCPEVISKDVNTYCNDPSYKRKCCSSCRHR